MTGVLPAPLFLQGPRLVEARPPSIARVAGITAGLTTLEGYERRHGKALRMMGGHSGGAGEWYDVRHGVLIHADGFNVAKGGEILDNISVEWTSSGTIAKSVPRIRLRNSDLGLLSRLRRGMSRRQTEVALGRRLSHNEVRDSGLVHYSPKPVNKADDRYTVWTLSLEFGGKGLSAFVVGCD